MKERIENLTAEHWLWHSRMLAGYPEPTEEERLAKPPAHHKLVQVHPGSGRKTLYIAAHASHIVGHAARRRTQAHQRPHRVRYPAAIRSRGGLAVEPGDLVIWDNRCTMHRATSFEDTRYRRDMRRTTVLETLA